MEAREVAREVLQMEAVEVEAREVVVLEAVEVEAREVGVLEAVEVEAVEVVEAREMGELAVLVQEMEVEVCRSMYTVTQSD